MSSKGLGRGLDALLRRTDMGAARQEKNDTPEKETGTEHSPTLLPLSHLHANPSQPRQTFDAESLAELAASIREQGIIQPLLVRPLADRPGHYQIVAGERRWRAARKAGLESLPAYIREVDDENLHAMALVENIQREDLNAIEIALGMQRLIDECNLTQEALSEKVGKKRSTVSNYMRLLKLPNEVQLALKEGLISMGHAKAIAGAPEELQLRLLKKCIRKGLSVRQIEELVRALTDPAAKPAAPAEDEEYPESYARLVEQLEKFFSQEISIKRSKNGGGRIVIDFSDDRDIDRFIEKFEKRGASAEIRNNK